MPSERDAWVGHGRHRLAAVHAHHGRALLDEETGHRQITSSAPSLTVTAGPAMTIVAPWPLLMVMPVSEIEMQRAGRRLQQNAAGRAGNVADHQRVLAGGLDDDAAARPAARPAPAREPRRPNPSSSRPRSDSPVALLELDPDA